MNRWLNTDQRDAHYLASIMGLKPTAHGMTIAEMDGHEPKAIGLYDNFNGRSVHSHIWLAPGYRPTRVFWWAMHDYPLMQMGATNIIATVKSSNFDAIRLVEHLGYKLTATIPDYHITGDDELIYVGTEENSTFWAKYRYGKASPPKYARNQLKVA